MPTCHDVELAERRTAWVERLLGDNKPVAVVVHMPTQGRQGKALVCACACDTQYLTNAKLIREANLVAPIAQHTKAARASRLEDVG